MIKQHDIQELFNEYKKEYPEELMHTRLVFTNGVKQLGYFQRKATYWGKQLTIGISNHILKNEDEAIDTLLHEIAHNIDFVRRGRTDHSMQWKRVAVEVGAKPNRVAEIKLDVKYKYELYCPKCQRVIARKHRLRYSGYLHSTCKTQVEVRKLY